MSERRGSYIMTYSGRQFWPLDPRAEEIDVEDVAHALSNLCRYTGHVREFYSVAEHSCYVADLVSPTSRLWGLLHDAPEAYLGDLASPTKHASADFAPAYRRAEARLERAVAERFGLPLDVPAIVKTYDSRVLETEAAQLMPPIPGRKTWLGYSQVPDLRIACWSPRRARREFLRRYEELIA